MLLGKIKIKIIKANTVMRKCVSVEERFTVTLRFLSTGHSVEDLKFTTGISASSLCSIILETCKKNLRSVKNRLHESVLYRSVAMDANTQQAKDRLVWIDMEMTGLDVQTCHILEVACIVTSPNLATIAESPPLIIHQPDDILNSMNEWCIENHRKSGLTEASRSSKLSLQEAESTLLQFLRTHTLEGKCPLAGNSVSYDRQFLQRYMPEVNSHLHYRIIDVSTVKELCRRWLPKVYSRAPMKALSHRALDDIRESIQELRFYRSAVFGSSSPK